MVTIRLVARCVVGAPTLVLPFLISPARRAPVLPVAPTLVVEVKVELGAIYNLLKMMTPPAPPPEPGDIALLVSLELRPAPPAPPAATMTTRAGKLPLLLSALAPMVVLAAVVPASTKILGSANCPLPLGPRSLTDVKYSGKIVEAARLPGVIGAEIIVLPKPAAGVAPVIIEVKVKLFFAMSIFT